MVGKLKQAGKLKRAEQQRQTRGRPAEESPRQGMGERSIGRTEAAARAESIPTRITNPMSEAEEAVGKLLSKRGFEISVSCALG